MTQIQVVSEEDQPRTPAGCPAGEAPVTQLIALSETATGPEGHACGPGGERSCCQQAACQPTGLRFAEPSGIAAVQVIAAQWRITAMEFLRQSTTVTLLTVRADLVARALQLDACASELAAISRMERPLALPAPGSLQELPPGDLE